MAWNEPGGNGKDPWGGRRNSGGPPDLDEIVKKIQEKLSGLFGGGSNQGNNDNQSPAGGGGGSTGASIGAWVLFTILGAIFLVWEMAYVIEPAERGVVMRFGSYVTTLEPGLNFRLPRPVETVTKVDVDKIRSVSHKAAMLTKDENIVDVELAVQYRVKDVTEFLFKVRGPDATLRQVTESALRDMVGNAKMDFVLTEGRSQIAAGSKELVQAILDAYQTGLLVTSVNMQPAKPPDEVKEAFDDAIKAREDEQRLINESEAYRNEILPKSRGAAARIRAEANAYKFKVIASAEGDASRFSQLQTEYEKAPEVTRQRLYLDAVGSVLTNTSKVFLDSSGTNNLLYLPIDKLMDKSESSATVRKRRAPVPAPSAPLTAEDDRRNQRDLRSRTR